MIRTRKALEESISEDPDKYRFSKPINDIVQEEDIMPALRSERELANDGDLRRFEFIVGIATERVAKINHLSDPFRAVDNFVKELPSLPTQASV
ncbi:unnamed protein product [Clonostachys solani]|uniref:Uncharacterized protein n=1 Tax=Clonostachys solani TaxID=160281 RepID=A0A9P0EI04_9HYPO|nr:unnamed protein product [Clonostachys solani]